MGRMDAPLFPAPKNDFAEQIICHSRQEPAPAQAGTGIHSFLIFPSCLPVYMYTYIPAYLIRVICEICGSSFSV